MQSAKCKLQSAQFQIQFQIGFHIQIQIKMQVQTAICKLQFTTSNLPALIWNLETVNCKQQSVMCNFQFTVREGKCPVIPIGH